MIEITERASDALQAAMARTDGQAAGVRITASKDGCSEITYGMGLVSGGLDDDLDAETRFGVRVFASKDSAALLMGCLLDYGETDNGLAFTFFNPNALVAEGSSSSSHSCSCGKGSCSSS
jgi:iron-sulfur cluster assembly accessory protein